jgi:hypothetical protein
VQPGEGTAQTAYRQLIVHGASCPTCRAVTDTGENAGRPCEASTRLFQEYRQARRGGCARL